MNLEVRVKLLPTQKRFFTSAKRYPAFIGGVGSGKTWAGAMMALQHVPTGDGMVIAPTFPMLRDATQYTLLSWLRDNGIPFQFNKADQEMRFVNGSRILFRSADNPDRLRGPNLSWAWLDEAAMMRAATWDILIGRLRIGAPKAWITTTPSGFNWVYDKWTSDDPNYVLINASTAENTYLPAEYIADLESSYSGEFAQQELHGQFVAFEGLVYSEFRRGSHVFDYEPPGEWQRVRAIDFGYTNPFVTLWGALDEDGRLYIYDEHYQRRELMEYHAAQITARGPVEWTVADHDAQDNAELRRYDISTVRAKKDVVSGIQKVKARLITQQDGRPRLFVHERCVNLLKEMGMYRWKENTTKEEPMKENDHAMDALRYMVMQLDGAIAPKITVL